MLTLNPTLFRGALVAIQQFLDGRHGAILVSANGVTFGTFGTDEDATLALYGRVDSTLALLLGAVVPVASSLLPADNLEAPCRYAGIRATLLEAQQSQKDAGLLLAGTSLCVPMLGFVVPEGELSFDDGSEDAAVGALNELLGDQSNLTEARDFLERALREEIEAVLEDGHKILRLLDGLESLGVPEDEDDPAQPAPSGPQAPTAPVQPAPATP